MPSTLVELRGELDTKRKKLADVFEQAGDDLDLSKVTAIDGDTAAKAHQIKAMNDELTDLGKRVDDLAAVESVAQRWKKRTDTDPAAGAGDAGRVPTGADAAKGKVEREMKTLGDLVTENVAYREFKGGQGPIGTFTLPELKTLMQTSAGWAPETTRGPRMVDLATRPLQVIDLIPMGETGQVAVVYMEETTFTNNAAEIAEAGLYPESALGLTERSADVRKIGTWLPVTDEQLEDVPQVRSYIDNRLTFMVRQRLDGQILVGNGTAPNLRGFLNVVGIQTQAKGADPTPDAVYKAMTKVRVTGRAIPTGVIFHPNDWSDIRLLRTADGIYIWGSPADAGPERIWGLAVAQADAITENTALVGDFATHSELVMRRDVEIQITNSHADFFVNGKQAIRADLRAALVVYRPAAFCTVTGV